MLIGSVQTRLAEDAPPNSLVVWIGVQRAGDSARQVLRDLGSELRRPKPQP